MNQFQLLVCFLLFGGTLVAQPEDKYYGNYINTNREGIYEGIEIYPEESTPGYCFLISHSVIDENGEIQLTELGLGSCEIKNGTYAVNMESEDANLWISFDEDEAGIFHVTTRQLDKETTTFTYSDIEEVYDPYTDVEYIDSEGTDGVYYDDEEPATEQEPDLYIREDGAEFYFMALDGFMAFALVGATNEQCEVNDLDGSLFIDESGSFYTYTNNDCEVFRIELKEDLLILKEGKCKDVHLPGCTSWAGTYRLYFK